MLLLAILGLIVNALILVGGGYVVVKARNVARANVEAFEQFFTSQGEAEPSDFVKVIGSAGQIIGREVAESTRLAIQGSIGGSMKGAVGELENMAIQEHPQAAILAAMPKAIKNNPLAMMAMQAILNKNIGVGGGYRGGNNKSKVKFNLGGG